VSSTLEPRSNSKVSGKLTLSEAKDGVRVQVQIAGAAPGKHGIHFHENGDCSAPDATSAKGHYNPANHQHGLPTATERHLGDLGNIEIGADGTGKLDFTLPGANLTPNAPNSLRGRALILHEKTDDGGQPVGNAGGRIGCAVVP
jgi:Cu-Zn family superoxide dismutase